MFKYYQSDPVALQVILNIEKNKDQFLAFRGFRAAPVNTNMIEDFNSHLEARLKPLKSFNSFGYAQLWLNGYKKLTDCSGKFRRLNGKIPLQMTLKPGTGISTFF